MRKTWAQKLEPGTQPHTTLLERGFGGVPAGALMFVATPMLVKRAVDAVPRGSAVTVSELRAQLAAANGAEATCPLTTGIFLRIVSEVAFDEIRGGAAPETVTPFWRVVDPTSPLAMKLSCGPEYIREMRCLEGIDA